MKSSSPQSLHHSLKLRGHAAGMRESCNLAEQLLWARLRAGQLGVWFRRQVVLLDSGIVDFGTASTMTCSRSAAIGQSLYDVLRACAM